VRFESDEALDAEIDRLIAQLGYHKSVQ